MSEETCKTVKASISGGWKQGNPPWNEHNLSEVKITLPETNMAPEHRPPQ